MLFERFGMHFSVETNKPGKVQIINVLNFENKVLHKKDISFQNKLVLVVEKA